MQGADAPLLAAFAAQGCDTSAEKCDGRGPHTYGAAKVREMTESMHTL